METIPSQRFLPPSMNSTVSTAITRSSLSRSSSRTRQTNERNQSFRSQTYQRPGIDTSVPTTYSRHNHPSSTQPQLAPNLASESRQASSSSVASASSFRTDTSLFSHSRETGTTATSTGSVLGSTSTASSYYELGGDLTMDVKNVPNQDRAIDLQVHGKSKTQDPQRPLSPSESLDSIGKSCNASLHLMNLSSQLISGIHTCLLCMISRPYHPMQHVCHLELDKLF